MRVVLDGENFIDALTHDTRQVLATLIEVCDQMVLNRVILREYSRNRNISAVLPGRKLARLRGIKPRPKVIEPSMSPRLEISSPAHQNLLQGAIRAQANIIVMNTELRGRWRDLALNLQQQYQLRVLRPDQYVAERQPEP